MFSLSEVEKLRKEAEALKSEVMTISKKYDEEVEEVEEVRRLKTLLSGTRSQLETAQASVERIRRGQYLETANGDEREGEEPKGSHPSQNHWLILFNCRPS